MKQPDLLSHFYYPENRRVNVQWYDIAAKTDLPDVKWHQVYAVGDVDGLVPIVHYAEAPKGDNLPGGKFETGETIDEALKREMVEELNYQLISWQPLGYQKVVAVDNGETAYQLRVYAKLKKIGDFINDPGGNVVGHSLIELKDLNKRIKYGITGDRMIELAKPHFS